MTPSRPMSPSVRVRVEEPDDRPAVETLVEEAFDDARVAQLVRLIRASNRWLPELSLVAERDGEIVGHVMFSVVDVVTPTDDRRGVLTLSPLAVLPAAQRSGVGRALVEAGLARADAAGHELVVLEGDPAYYGRLGFTSALDAGIERPSDRIPPAGWQIHRLGAYDPTLRGRVEYPSYFWETVGVGPPERMERTP